MKFALVSATNRSGDREEGLVQYCSLYRETSELVETRVCCSNGREQYCQEVSWNEMELFVSENRG